MYAYVTVLAPACTDELDGHVRDLVAASVRGISLYHLGWAGLGLASREGRRVLGELSTVAASLEAP